MKSNSTFNKDGNISYETKNTILLISNGMGGISDSYLNELSGKGVIINTVAVPGAEGINTLKRIAQATGGKSYTSHDAVSLTQPISEETI